MGRRDKGGSNPGSFFTVRHRKPCRGRVVRRDFLETVDAGHRKDTGLRIDFELVAFARVDFLAVEKPDYEHRVPPIQRTRADSQ